MEEGETDLGTEGLERMGRTRQLPGERDLRIVGEKR